MEIPGSDSTGNENSNLLDLTGSSNYFSSSDSSDDSSYNIKEVEYGKTIDSSLHYYFFYKNNICFNPNQSVWSISSINARQCELECVKNIKSLSNRCFKFTFNKQQKVND